MSAAKDEKAKPAEPPAQQFSDETIQQFVKMVHQAEILAKALGMPVYVAFEFQLRSINALIESQGGKPATPAEYVGKLIAQASKLVQ